MPTPRFEPTSAQRDACMIMKAGGMTNEQIASVFNIREKTLVKYLKKELSAGKANVDARVMGTLARLASSGDCPAATFFWLKTRCGWRETTKHEIGGIDGGPIETSISSRDALLSAISQVVAVPAEEGSNSKPNTEPGGRGAV